MDEAMRVKLSQIGESNVLAGAILGRHVLATLISETSKGSHVPELVFLDFSGIEVATASFLRESILAFRDIVRSRRSTFYPVVANANDTVHDELMELLRSRGDALMTCELDEAGNVLEARPLGDLDPKQQITFDLVCKHGETDASELMRHYGQREGVQQTAWNNRLSALAVRGLVLEVSQGRMKRYKSLFKE